MNELIAFLAGVIVSSITWFFIWKNNKEEFDAVAEKCDQLENYVAEHINRKK